MVNFYSSPVLFHYTLDNCVLKRTFSHSPLIYVFRKFQKLHLFMGYVIGIVGIPLDTCVFQHTKIDIKTHTNWHETAVSYGGIWGPLCCFGIDLLLTFFKSSDFRPFRLWYGAVCTFFWTLRCFLELSEKFSGASVGRQGVFHFGRKKKTF